MASTRTVMRLTSSSPAPTVAASRPSRGSLGLLAILVASSVSVAAGPEPAGALYDAPRPASDV